MPAQKRHKTRYDGVTFIESTGPDGQPERSFYIRYRKDGRIIEEKAGRARKDKMTAAGARQIRARRIDGEPSNAERRQAAAQAMEAEQNRWTISRLWESYKTNNPHLKGIITDQNRFDNHLRDAFGDKMPDQLLPLDVNRLRLSMLKKRSPGTAKNTLELLRRIINYGAKNQLCSAPGFTITMPAVNNLVTEDLTGDQLRALMDAINEDHHPQAGTMMLLALFTGLRRGEMFRLKWEHIDFDRGFILLVDPKGGVDQKVPLNKSARDLLIDHHRVDGSPFVFPGKGGRQRTDIKKAVTAIRKAAGLPDSFRPLHGLRHCFASMLASSGQVDLYTLQKLLTHKSPAMVQRYAHLRDETLRRASDLAGDLVNGAMTEKIRKVKE